MTNKREREELEEKEGFQREDKKRRVTKEDISPIESSKIMMKIVMIVNGQKRMMKKRTPPLTLSKKKKWGGNTK